jgi:hypothetical protein
MGLLSVSNGKTPMAPDIASGNLDGEPGSGLDF